MQPAAVWENSRMRCGLLCRTISLIFNMCSYVCGSVREDAHGHLPWPVCITYMYACTPYSSLGDNAVPNTKLFNS